MEKKNAQENVEEDNLMFEEIEEDNQEIHDKNFEEEKAKIDTK